MKFKIYAILLALILSLSLLLTGCDLGELPGNGDGTSENGGNEGSGNESSGNEGSGNEGSGNEGSGDEGSGDEGSGNEGSGNEGSGNEGSGNEGSGNEGSGDEEDGKSGITLDEIPEYSGTAYVVINGNTPFFKSSQIKNVGSVSYTELDALGRCGVALACIGPETLPTDDRENISGFTPSGWTYNGKSNNKTYAILGGQTIYNRTHLLAHQLVQNDADARNLITGTPYMNQNTMTSFENMVADYVKETGNHVMYRITPMFDGDNLVASGVLMEAYSVEDEGDEVCFCVFLYNVQPGIEINYLTGENKLIETEDNNDVEASESLPEAEVEYLLFAESGGKIYYFASAGSTLATTEDVTKAKKVMFEASDTAGYYYVYYIEGGERVYINMKSNTTTSFSTSKDKSTVTAWKIDLDKKQIVNKTYSNRAMAFYAAKEDIRNYATSQTQTWVWFTKADAE